MAIRNIWSLTTDEAIVADKIRKELSKKKYEVFFPTNAQLKDIDLIVFDLRKRKSLTAQIKGSRTYEPNKSQTQRFGAGSAGWITLTKKSISPDNKIDFFIFVIYSTTEGHFKKAIEESYLILPTPILKKFISKKTLRKGGKYHFTIWVDAKGKRAFDFNERKGNKILLMSKYLNKWNLLRK